MLTLALAAALLGAPPQTTTPQQATTPPSARPPAAPADTGDTDRARRHRHENRPPRHDPVTPELERSAFRDAGARTLLMRARAARVAQDSALESYDAKSFSRVSVGMGLSRFARERLLFRSENAARVRWHRGTGVWMDVTGARAAVPMMREANAEVDASDLSPIPYFPGRDALWFPGQSFGMVKAEVDDREFVHPLAQGSEAYYRFSTGDSSSIRLPDGRAVRLRELRVQPRRPDFKLFAGSFWFDAASGQLVRAAYRPSVPMEVWAFVKDEQNMERGELRQRLDSARLASDTALQRRLQHELKDEDEDDVPKWVSGALSPARFTIGAVTVEYGLYEGRFWMPRANYAEGGMQLGFMRMPVKIEESFRYASVNGRDSLPPLPQPAAGDSAEGVHVSVQIGSTSAKDSAAGRHAADSSRAAARKRARAAECAATGSTVRTESRYDGALRYAVRVPCDTAALAHSADLPPSIYEEADTLFNARDRDELVNALNFSLQPAWAPQPPVLHYGLDMQRYDRVEGLSLGAGVTEALGRGYTADAVARFGLADRSPNAELGLSRSDGRRTVGVRAYRRLAAANDDWGSPLTFGSSLASFLYARDEGFYYRAWGAELVGEPAAGPGGLTWRLFGEREGRADVNTNFSLGRVWGADFLPNIAAPRAGELGGAAELRGSLGSADPYAMRLAAGVRAEAAAGTFDYTRGMVDATLSRSLFAGLAGALTGSAGTSGGTLAPQRAFYLGGLRTVRGQDAGTAVGDAFWMGRAEVGLNVASARPIAFFDVGWAGRRDSFFSNPGRPISGAGVGASFLDGLLRVDVAEGVRPRRGARADVYLEARF